MKGTLLLLSIVALVSGCATHTREQIAAVRAAGVSPRLVYKLEHEGFLSPEDLIQLRRHRVNDSVAIRQLDDVGVDYLVQRDDIKRLRNAGVDPGVVDELVSASHQFANRQYRRTAWSVGFYAPLYPWYGYYGPYGYGWPYCY